LTDSDDYQQFQSGADRLSTDLQYLRRFYEVAADVWAAFQVGVKRIVELIPKTDDLSKVAIATGIIYDKAALITGQATTRTESRSLVDGMDDHERQALKRMLTEALEEVDA
jgi:hypothetical protein